MNQLSHDKKNVLVIDDEPVICELLEDVLEMLGFNPMTYSSPLDAIDVYRGLNQKVYFVIMDMMMPMMNGQELFIEMRQINPDVKVVVLSGYSMINKIDDMLKNGVVGFLQKPVTINQLTDIIRKI